MRVSLVSLILLIHSWYDRDCCSNTDCHPIESCDELHELPDGQYSWTDQAGHKFNFRQDRIRPSKDGKYHVCTLGTAYGLCAYIQLGT